LIAPPPRSPLFPYTTLFRSAPLRVAVSRYRWSANRLERPLHFCPDVRVELLGSGAGGTVVGPGGPALHPCGERGDVGFRHLPLLDRKSTRLNSSHRTISYAV